MFKLGLQKCRVQLIAAKDVSNYSQCPCNADQHVRVCIVFIRASQQTVSDASDTRELAGVCDARAPTSEEARWR